MMLITVSENILMLAPGNEVIFPHRTWEDYERLLNLRQYKTHPKLYFNAKTQEIRLREQVKLAEQINYLTKASS